MKSKLSECEKGYRRWISPNQPKKEIPLKQWVAEMAHNLGLTERAIHKRLKQGYYPNLQLRRVNQRVVFVRV